MLPYYHPKPTLPLQEGDSRERCSWMYEMLVKSAFFLFILKMNTNAYLGIYDYLEHNLQVFHQDFFDPDPCYITG